MVLQPAASLPIRTAGRTLRVARRGARESATRGGRRFSTLLIRDHFLDEPFGPQYAPLTTLASIAAVTSTLRVGTLVIDNDFRHPAVLAKEATSLGQLSNGRLELGLGAGFFREEYDRIGLSFDSNGERVARFGEALGVLDALLRGRPFTHTGPHYCFEQYVNFPPSIQLPRVPILVGAGGRRMLGIAAAHADAICFLSSPLSSGVLRVDASALQSATLAQQIQWVREAARERFSAIEMSVFISVGEPNDAPHDAENIPRVLTGSVDQMADQLRARRARFGLNYLVVRDSQLAEAAPLVAALAST
jgi:probable F420-dependent oxidoreductase